MRASKRAFDLAGAGLGLLISWPVLLVVACCIKLDDGGPVFFLQERVGWRGKLFKMWKFRTMRVREDAGAPLTVGHDARVTRVGRWLRELKLDELPQLFNVLRGQMSFVGPRPEVPYYVSRYTPEQRLVLERVPGITDPASLWYWNESELLGKSADPERMYLTQILPDKIKMQMEYPTRSGLLRDVSLILDTLEGLLVRLGGVIIDHLMPFRRLVIVGVQIFLIIVAYALAFELRFDFDQPISAYRMYWVTLPLLLAIRLAVFRHYRLFGGYWQHVGLEDLATLGRAMTVSSLLFGGVLLALGLVPGVPRSVLLLDWAAGIFLGGGVRITARYLQEMQRPPSFWYTRRTIVVGVGNKAERLLREARRDLGHSLRIVGVLSDDETGPDQAIHGVPLLGSVSHLVPLVARHRVELIVIALDAPTAKQMQTVVDHCAQTGVEFKTIPSLKELLDSFVGVAQLRSVRIEDLLGRAPVDLPASSLELHDKVVLITGGAGSIGSELARIVARCGPQRLVLVDQAESALYFILLELRELTPDVQVMPVVCDVTDEASLAQVFADHQPHYVIHAAAYKHVPMMEHNVLEAVRNNVVGTLLVADAAATWGAEKFVLISSDKAVNPSSVMGATKRIAERLVLGLPALRRAGTDVRAVRFGNVLASAGSVVPVFERQIASGGPVTVTHPEVERYFMTITEAAQLVLEAGALPEAAGHITMLDMGTPIRIVDLAEKLIRLAGKVPYQDIPIVFTGLRPGEKLREELMSGAETGVPTAVDKIRIVLTSETTGAEVRRALEQLLTDLRSGDSDAVLASMCAMVPECVAPLRTRPTMPQEWRRPKLVSGPHAVRTFAEGNVGIG